MTTVRVLIVDDEPLARRGIRQLLREHSDMKVVGEARDGREALRFMKSHAPDLVFLDVQMPEMDGFEVLRKLPTERVPAVIFVTAYDTYAVSAFEAHAIDYLVKPVQEQRFHSALARARTRLRSDEAIALSKRLSELLASHGIVNPNAAREPLRRLIIHNTGAELVIDSKEIDWVAADDYYAAVYSKGRRYLIRESLESLEDRLDPACFVRVHRSAVVNLARVREVQSDAENSAVVLMDGTRVPVSRRRRAMVYDAVRRFAG